MGLKQSQPSSTTEIVTLDSFYNAGKATNNIYESRLSNSSANKQLIHRAISYTQSSETVTRYLAMLQNVGRKVECSNLYLPVLCGIKPAEVVCADYQTLSLYYEQYVIKIKQEIDARRRHREKFTQEEIWYIVYSIIKAIRMFEKVGMASGNLKTEKILLNEKGHLKVINILSYPEDTNTFYEEGTHQSGVQRFFSPEQLRAMRERIDKRINPNIAQTFAVGIILLELATFISGDSFYDMRKMALNDYELKRADQLLSQNYSKLLYNLTRTMLSGQYDRPLPSQIYTVFQPYQKRILALKPFDFRPLGHGGELNVSNASLMSL